MDLRTSRSLAVLLLVLGACAWRYPPGSPPYRPEPQGPRSVDALLAEPPPPASPTLSRRAHLTLRLTTCFARTVAFLWAPADLCAEIDLEPDPAHRWFRLRWELDGVPVGESLRSVEGDLAPRHHQIELVGLPGGAYEVEVVVYSDPDRRKVHCSARAPLVVMERQHGRGPGR